MAQWELDHGSDEKLLNIAESIIAEQTAEITQLQAARMDAPTPADCETSMAPDTMVSWAWIQSIQT